MRSKEIFERNQTSLLHRITRGVPVTGFLNVDLPKVLHRRADMIASLADGSVLHVEFQSRNSARLR